MRQASFLALAQQKKTLRCERFLKEMERVIPWGVFLKEILPWYEEKVTGRPKTDVILLLKIYFLQQWYNLSDPGAEEAIYDRNSFQKFLDIDLLSSNVPDETTILNFRHLLEAHRLPEQWFEKVNQVLEEKGLLMKEGTIVDATIISAPSSTKNRMKKRDPEMSSTKKGNDWYFGMKGHIGVDDRSGLVKKVKTTTAKVNDNAVVEELWDGREKRKWGDKGYYNEQSKKAARSAGVYWGILDRGKSKHPLSSAQKKRNRRYSSVRSKVEHPFQILNCQWGYNKVRYRGLFKNTMQLFSLFTLINLFKVRKVLPLLA